jgi:hypothetical protein
MADRRAAAARQAAYRKRRRLGLVMLTFEVGQADLTAEGLHRQLLGSAGATRTSKWWSKIRIRANRTLST